MTLLSVAFGQCGNQVANSLFSYLYTDIKDKRSDYNEKLESEYREYVLKQWFHVNKKSEKLSANCVLIDTEDKAIDSFTKHRDNVDLLYDDIVKESCGGAGNNWAHGYHATGSILIDSILEHLRKRAERSDYLTGFLNLLSSSGGTGSGVGAYAIEKIKDLYPNKIMASAIVLPYENGEVVTQNYNTVLTLAKIYDTSDMCILFQNEQLQLLLEKLLKIESIEFGDINKLIAQKLASVFQPVSDGTKSNWNSNVIWNVVNQMCPHPSYRLTTIKTTPHTAKQVLRYEAPGRWFDLLCHAKQMLRSSTSLDWEIKYASSSVSRQSIAYATCISNMVLTRGHHSDAGPIILDSLQDDIRYPAWVPNTERLVHKTQPRPLAGANLFLTLLTNNSTVQNQVDRIVAQAWNMFAYDACLHQYTQYGMEMDTFLEAFAKVENMVKNYNDLIHK